MTRAPILIVAPRQLELAKRRASVNHPQTRPPLLIQIDAPFSPRLSRHNIQTLQAVFTLSRARAIALHQMLVAPIATHDQLLKHTDNPRQTIVRLRDGLRRHNAVVNSVYRTGWCLRPSDRQRLLFEAERYAASFGPEVRSLQLSRVKAALALATPIPPGRSV